MHRKTCRDEKTRGVGSTSPRSIWRSCRHRFDCSSHWSCKTAGFPLLVIFYCKRFAIILFQQNLPWTSAKSSIYIKYFLIWKLRPHFIPKLTRVNTVHYGTQVPVTFFEAKSGEFALRVCFRFGSEESDHVRRSWTARIRALVRICWVIDKSI